MTAALDIVLGWLVLHVVAIVACWFAVSVVACWLVTRILRHSK